MRSQNLSNPTENFGQGRKKAGDLADLDTTMVTMVPHTWGNTIVPRSPYLNTPIRLNVNEKLLSVIVCHVAVQKAVTSILAALLLSLIYY